MRTFEYRLRPTRAQEQALMNTLIASRKMYNACLEELITHYQETGKHLHLYEQDKRHGKEAHPDLPAVVVDTTIKRLHRSFTNFFQGRKQGRKIGFPRFKGAHAWNTIQFRDAANCLDNGRFKAPKQMGGRIRVIVHRPLEGTFKFARLVLRPSGWYVQCVCETQPQPLPKKGNTVGLDMGIRYLVADSNGHITPNPKHAKKSAKKLAKAESAGRQVVAVAPHYTSQKCSSCGEYVQKSLSVRTHVCPFCGYIADRDENAARNILQRGLQVLARTEPSSSRREGPEQSGESPSALKREAAGL